MSTKRSSIFRWPANANGSAAPSDGGLVVDREYQPVGTSGPSLKGLSQLKAQVKKGLAVELNQSTASSIIDLIRRKDSIDDRKLLLEHALSFVSKLPEGQVEEFFKKKIIELLYNDLAHPPATLISNKYAWRTADGSYNNIEYPDLGKAGTPYARSVQQTHPLPPNQLPDSGLIFDTLLKREEFVQHPGGLSSLMFSFAALVIHSVFRTSHRDWNINETSSYVDLAPLYGNNQETQDRVRIRDGRGKLHPDAFAEDRLLLLPPAVCVLLVLFSRNHNYIADKLLEINERGTYINPTTVSPDDPKSKAKLLQQEEEIFQISRLINCGWFGMVVFSDYFSTILGLVRDGSSWSLTPFDEMRNDDHSLFERGKGNQCSVEFNCLYRWHATTSQEDEEWTTQVFAQVFDNKPVDEITVDDFRKAAAKLDASEVDLPHWNFGKIQRQENGSFKDDDLANILHDATEHKAATFGARGTPAVFRLNEIMGIEQNRKWGVCSLNDFRKYLGLKPYSTFLEWNSNPEIADAAQKLYGNIDYLELYVGLQAEEAKPLVDGAGLCPGYTISRAILSDAIALTRGDRFFTHDFTPYNLTAWGFADCQRDPNAFGFGSTLGRLLLRTLPNNFTENSVYTFFPLMTPESMKTNLTKLGVLDQYDLSRPKSKTGTTPIDGYTRVKSVLADKEGFQTPYKARVDRVLEKSHRFFPIESDKEQQAVITVLSSPELLDGIGRYFYESTKKLIDSNSYTLVGGKVAGVDIVRQVLTTVPVYWAATELAGIQLKTAEHPHGVYSAAELYEILGEIYAFVFLEVEASKVMVMQKRVKANVQKLLHLIKSGLGDAAGPRLSFSALFDTVSSLFKLKKSDHHGIVKRLYELGHSTDQLTNTILALMVTSTVELSLALTNVLNYYLGTQHVEKLASIAKSTDGAAGFDGYIYEALRLEPTFRGVFRVSTKDQTLNGQDFKKGDKVFIGTALANLDDKVFPDPATFNASRSPKDHVRAEGVFNYLGEGLTIKILSQVLRAVFEFSNIRRAPNQSGALPRFKVHNRPELFYGYLNSAQIISEFPTSMSIQFDIKN
ncbi:linoleate diol synthase [Gymnopilus junonius]|uniref:Linoleate diol synthase n=1 Tax=Gymnopilus junonius TaxID=109634 RepID=A0A9P5NTQ7_GYMJU|nr:linoleate diol synthase [Gymnopilus junonius]